MDGLPKYALMERERRFLVDAAFVVPTSAPAFEIDDLYLDAGRLRLRRIVSADEQRTFKLCKKYPSDDPFATPITNLYLTESEYLALASLPGARLTKTRHHVQDDGRRFGLDVFAGELAGLRLAEISMDDAAALKAITAPAWAAREVTEDAFFQGGNLVRLDRGELLARLG